MKTSAKSWLLLVTNLPGSNQTLRMRVWRALKATGAASLRDGVYVLPGPVNAQQAFKEQAQEIQTGGGNAHVLPLDNLSKSQQTEFIALFDRTAEYTKVISQLNAFKRTHAKLAEGECRKRLNAIKRDADAVVAIDFFPGEPQLQMLSALNDAEAVFNAKFSIDEPHSVHRKIPCHDPKDYVGRTWATREKLWIDRICSAWLIKRFIDRKAKFIWLKRITDCPKRAVGFDFDGAEFTHVESKVTFEVLLTCFGLNHDVGLTRLAAMVHFLDVGGIPIAEASGFSAVVAGARALQPSDDALLTSLLPVLDSLYATFSDATAKNT